MALHVCQDPVAVLENRRILADQTLPLDHWALPWQKHTANSHRVTAAERGRGAADKDTSIMDVDAVWTTEPDTLVGVFTADCVGLLVADPGIPLVACIHSGWKGTAQAITLKTMRELISVGGLDPARAQAWFSPSILQDSLEVGPEVIEAMKRNNAVYFGAIGGAGALLAKCIKKAEVVCYEDLGAEAIRRLEVENLPAVVIIDSLGNNLYEDGRKAYLAVEK